MQPSLVCASPSLARFYILLFLLTYVLVMHKYNGGYIFTCVPNKAVNLNKKKINGPCLITL